MEPPDALDVASVPDTGLMLVEEISHRVVNEYTRAIASLRSAASQVKDASARQALQDAARSLYASAESHLALRAPLTKHMIDLNGYLGQICRTLSALIEPNGIRLVVIQNTSTPTRAALCWRVGLIIAELINNAARHWLQMKGGEIRLDTEAIAARLLVSVSDYGEAIGIPKIGRGRRLVRSLTEEIGGREDWLFSRAGTIVNFVFTDNRRIRRRISLTIPAVRYLQLCTSASATTRSWEADNTWRTILKMCKERKAYVVPAVIAPI